MFGTPRKTGLRSYGRLAGGIRRLLEDARRQAARSVNAVLTATYWEIGRRIVEFEQGGKGRAGYGEAVVERLSQDLTQRFGRGFSANHLWFMRRFYQAWPTSRILESPIQESRGSRSIQKSKSTLRRLSLPELAEAFPLSWTHYARLLRVKNPRAREFYFRQALHGGWSVRQLHRQIESQFYERTALSRNKAAMLKKGAKAKSGERMTPEEEIKDPYVLEFLGLKDEYSENEMEEAIIRRLEGFLLELGGDFTFVARQKRLRVGNAWYRVDLVFYHRSLRCLVLIDLKIGGFTHSDAGQMHLYLNYARRHWTHKNENPPVGLILCAEKDDAVARYALEGLPNKVLASEYRTSLPKERTLEREIKRAELEFDRRRSDRR